MPQTGAPIRPTSRCFGNLPRAIADRVTFFERWSEEIAMNAIEDPAVRDARRKPDALSRSER